MNATIIVAIIGVIWWFAVAAYWQRRYRAARDEANDALTDYSELADKYCHVVEEYTAVLNHIADRQSKPAHTRRPTLRFSRLDGEPGKVFGGEVVDGVGYIWSEN